MVETSSQMLAALKAAGLRMTPQRQMIVEAIAESEGHISAEAIHSRVSARFPQVNLSTVYRTLDLLQELGLVAHTHFDDGVALYHRASEAGHQHLVCRRCGAEQELDASLLEPLAETLRRQHGFEPDLAHFAIVGLCAACRTAGEPRDASREA